MVVSRAKSDRPIHSYNELKPVGLNEASRVFKHKEQFFKGKHNEKNFRLRRRL